MGTMEVLTLPNRAVVQSRTTNSRDVHPFVLDRSSGAKYPTLSLPENIRLSPFEYYAKQTTEPSKLVDDSAVKTLARQFILAIHALYEVSRTFKGDDFIPEIRRNIRDKNTAIRLYIAPDRPYYIAPHDFGDRQWLRRAIDAVKFLDQFTAQYRTGTRDWRKAVRQSLAERQAKPLPVSLAPLLQRYITIERVQQLAVPYPPYLTSLKRAA